MSRHTNPAGFVRYDSEAELCHELEKHFFPYFFDAGWKPIIGETKEVYIRKTSIKYNQQPKDRIDYFGYKNSSPTYVEVKNERIRQKHLLQIVRYYCQANEENPQFKFYVICKHKIRPHREVVLKQLNIIILDEEEIKPTGVSSWM